MSDLAGNGWDEGLDKVQMGKRKTRPEPMLRPLPHTLGFAKNGAPSAGMGSVWNNI
jgi:hypothetical protein